MRERVRDVLCGCHAQRLLVPAEVGDGCGVVGAVDEISWWRDGLGGRCLDAERPLAVEGEMPRGLFFGVDESGSFRVGRVPEDVDSAELGPVSSDCPGESSAAVTCWYWPTLTYRTASSWASTSSTKSLMAGVGA